MAEFLLDIGSSKTMIDASLVLGEKINKSKVISMQCAHCDMKQYLVATVEIEVNGNNYSVGAAVVAGLPRTVLLGRDVKGLVALILEEDQKINRPSLAVMTRKLRMKKRRGDKLDERHGIWSMAKTA